MKLRIDCVLAVLLLALALGVRSSDALTLPAGLNMSQITQMGEVLDKCNGDFVCKDPNCRAGGIIFDAAKCVNCGQVGTAFEP